MSKKTRVKTTLKLKSFWSFLKLSKLVFFLFSNGMNVRRHYCECLTYNGIVGLHGGSFTPTKLSTCYKLFAGFNRLSSQKAFLQKRSAIKEEKIEELWEQREPIEYVVRGPNLIWRAVKV